MPYAVGNRVIRMVNDNGDGTITLTLAARNSDGNRRTVTLDEPNALVYARIRERVETVDDQVREKFAEPQKPVIPEGSTDEAAGLITLQYAQEVQRYNRELQRYARNPDDPPYAGIVIHIIDALAGETVTLEDLPVEAFDYMVCSVLLRIWEGPYDGPAAPAVSPEDNGGSEATPATEVPGGPSADSRGTDESSPPGTEPSIPSPPPS